MSGDGLKFVDFFAGLGGFRVALERNGFRSVYGADNNEHAAEIYEANFGENILGDISKIDPKTLPDFDVFCGGFPCQPFSLAGRQLGFEDTRGTVFFDVCRILEEKKPRVVFLENVKNLASHDSGNTMKVILKSLENLGYAVSVELMNAVDYGVPQSRERVFIVGVLNGSKFDFSKISKRPRKPLKEFLDPDEGQFEWLSPEDYVILDEDMRKVQPKTGLIFAGYRKATLRGNGVKPNTEHLSRAHRQPNRIYSAEGSHPTLSSQEGSGRCYIYVEKEEGVYGVRKMTIGECFRVFGFSDSYVKVGALSKLYNRIGNSVAVPLVELIAKEIREQAF